MCRMTTGSSTWDLKELGELQYGNSLVVGD